MPDSMPTYQAPRQKRGPSKKTITIIAAVVAVLFVLFGIYSLGVSSGKEQQKEESKKQAASKKSDITKLPQISKDYWSVVGNVEKVSATSITVKNNKGVSQTADITDKTEVTEKPSKKVEVGAIKSGGKVIVIGTKTDDGKTTAKTIRIQ